MTELLNYYKDLYEQEIEFSQRLNSKISNSLAILTVIGSGHVLLATELFPLDLPRSIGSVAFFALFCVSLFFLYKSIYWFRAAYSGYEYAYYPIKEMGQAIRNSVWHGKLYGKEREAKEHLMKLMIIRYKTDAIHNRETNARKNKMHYRLSNALIRSFSTLVITFMCWIIFFKG